MRRPAILLPLALAACAPEPTAIVFHHESLVVHAVLVAGDSSASVLVERMREGAGSGGGIGAVAVPGAVVELSGGGETVRLTTTDLASDCRLFYRDGSTGPYAGCYVAALPRPIQPGVEYRLRVELPSGEVVAGSTIVPALPLIEGAAAAVFEVPRLPSGSASSPSMEVRWSGVSPANRAEVRVATDTTECGITLRSEHAGLGGDVLYVGSRFVNVTGATSARIGGYLLVCAPNVTFERGPGLLLLSAYDDNYSAYVAHQRGARPVSEAAVGITGAFGVFGSVATAAQPLEIVAR